MQDHAFTARTEGVDSTPATSFFAGSSASCVTAHLRKPHARRNTRARNRGEVAGTPPLVAKSWLRLRADPHACGPHESRHHIGIGCGGKQSGPLRAASVAFSSSAWPDLGRLSLFCRSPHRSARAFVHENRHGPLLAARRIDFSAFRRPESLEGSSPGSGGGKGGR